MTLYLNRVHHSPHSLVRNAGSEHTPAYELRRGATDTEGRRYPPGTPCSPLGIGSLSPWLWERLPAGVPGSAVTIQRVSIRGAVVSFAVIGGAK